MPAFFPVQPVKLLTFLAAIAIGGVAARAQTVASALYNYQTEMAGYNLVALSTSATTTLSGYGDTQGAIEILGKASISGGSIDDQVAGTSNPSLYVGGTLTLSGETELGNGYASISTSNSSAYTWNASAKTLTAKNNSGNLNLTNSGSSVDPLGATAPNNLSNLASQLTSDSTALANATANGTSVIAGTISVNSNNLLFTPNSTPAAKSTVIFTLNANDLSGTTYNGATFSNIAINVPSDVNYVINVVNASGKTLFSGANMNTGSNDSNLLWNIEGSGTVAIDSGGSFYGSILAPSATVTNSGTTTINGEVAANAFTDTNVELHDISFNAVSVVIPEPVTFALWGIGLCALAIFARSKLLT